MNEHAETTVGCGRKRIHLNAPLTGNRRRSSPHDRRRRINEIPSL